MISFISAVQVGDLCGAAGEFDQEFYCGFDGTIEEKYDIGSCANNYECASGACVDGECQSTYKEIKEHTNFLQAFYQAIVNFFTGQDIQCTPGETQDCGPVEAGIGICTLGTETCEQNAQWGECNAVYPNTQGEICDNGDDDDCNGNTDCDDSACVADPSCDLACEGEEERPCGSDVGECSQGTQRCEHGEWGECYGGQGPVDEVCDDGDDNDCDGDTDCDDTASCRNDPACDTSSQDQDCEPLQDTRSCGPNNDTGQCQQGLQTCDNHGAWGPCEDYTGPSDETCDGIDNDCSGDLSANEYDYSTGTEVCNDPDAFDEDCDGYANLEDTDSCDACGGQIAVDCSQFDSDQGTCASTVECTPEGQACVPHECADFGDDEESCILADDCSWNGVATIFCGNQEIDPILNEECDLANLGGYDCTDYLPNSDFTGGTLSCVLPDNTGQCTFNTTLCTITIQIPPEDQGDENVSITEVNGLPENTEVTVDPITEFPPEVDQPNNTVFLGGFSLDVTEQPDGIAKISFDVNRSLVTHEDYVQLFRVEEGFVLTGLNTELTGSTDDDFNYSSETDHFSDFLILEGEPECGNEMIDAIIFEECDNSYVENPLNSENCTSLGFYGGTLSCADDCTLDISECYYEPAGDDNGDDNGNGGGGGGGGGGDSSIQIVVYTPRTGITYGNALLSLEVGDKRKNAEFWRYSINNGAKTIFTPNSTFVATPGTNVLKVYAKEESGDTYEAQKLVSFVVVDNPEGYCGDDICDDGEDCDSCSSDCGSCAFLEGFCGDNICDPGEDYDNCSADCGAPPGGKSKAVVFAIIIILILGGIGVVVYIMYNRSKGKKSPGISQRRPYSGGQATRPSYGYS